MFKFAAAALMVLGSVAFANETAPAAAPAHDTAPAMAPATDATAPKAEGKKMKKTTTTKTEKTEKKTEGHGH